MPSIFAEVLVNRVDAERLVQMFLLMSLFGDGMADLFQEHARRWGLLDLRAQTTKD